MITQKIVCDNCGVEMKEHAYFVCSTTSPVGRIGEAFFIVSVTEHSMPDESGIIRHACGDRCLMNMLSDWTMVRKRGTDGDDTVRSSN